jgi:hypothetical protein
LDLTDPELKSSWVEKKIEEGKTRLTRQDLVVTR